MNELTAADCAACVDADTLDPLIGAKPDVPGVDALLRLRRGRAG